MVKVVFSVGVVSRRVADRRQDRRDVRSEWSVVVRANLADGTLHHMPRHQTT